MRKLLAPLSPLLDIGIPSSKDDQQSVIDPTAVRAMFDPGHELLKCGEALKEKHFLGSAVSNGNDMALRYFELRRTSGCCALVYFKSKDDLSQSAAEGIVVLDATATVKRTKNVRDGYMYCIRIDTPNAGGVQLPGVKRWPKLVMALRSEPDMESWIAAIRTGIEGGQLRMANQRVMFDVSQSRSQNMIVFQGDALKEAHSLGFSMIDSTSMKLRHFVLKIVDGSLVLLYYKGSDECLEMLKGAIELDAAATVQRTKNARDGFEYCVRIDAPNAGTGAAFATSKQPAVKRWTKLVMVLRSEPEMSAWLAAIRWGLQPLISPVAETAAVDAAPHPTDSLL